MSRTFLAQSIDLRVLVWLATALHLDPAWRHLEKMILIQDAEGYQLWAQGENMPRESFAVIELRSVDNWFSLRHHGFAEQPILLIPPLSRHDRWQLLVRLLER